MLLSNISGTYFKNIYETHIFIVLCTCKDSVTVGFCICRALLDLCAIAYLSIITFKTILYSQLVTFFKLYDVISCSIHLTENGAYQKEIYWLKAYVLRKIYASFFQKYNGC